MGFSGGSDGKESTCNAGDVGSIPGLGRYARGGHGNPLQYSLLENPLGQRSLVGYSPWGCKESHTSELLSTHSSIYFKLQNMGMVPCLAVDNRNTQEVLALGSLS